MEDKNLKAFTEQEPLLPSINAQYEGVNKEKKEGTVSVLGASFLLWTDVAGVGALATGYNMAIGGVYYTIAITLIVAYISEYTLKVIYFLYEKYQKSDYIEMCTFALGKHGRFFACLFMLVFNFGILVVNVMVIGSAVPALLSAAFGEHFLFHRQFVLLYAFCVILPVTFLRDISSYTWTSAVYVVCFLVTVAMCWFLAIQYNVTNHFKGFHKLTAISFPGLISATGSISYVFVCHDMSFSIAASMYKPTPTKWLIVCRACMLCNIFLTLGLGLFAYTQFLDDTEAFIPANYIGREGGAYIIIARLAIIVMVLSGIPYSCFLPRRSLETLLYTFVEKDKLKESQLTAMHVLCTVVVPVGAVGIAVATEDLGSILSFLGGFSASGLAFILPPLAFVKLEAGRWYSMKKLPYILILAFGIFSILLVSGVTIQGIVQSFHH